MKKQKLFIMQLLLALSLGLGGCGDAPVSAEEAVATVVDTALTEVTIPNVNFVGVIQDKSGNPLSGISVAIGDSTDTTNDLGFFEIKNIPVQAGVHLGDSNMTQSVGNTKVNIVIAGTSNYLGATMEVNIEKYLVALYTYGDTSAKSYDADTNITYYNTPTVYYTDLDGKEVHTGIVQLPTLNASVTGRLEDTITQLPLTGTAYFTFNDETINGTNGTELIQTSSYATVVTNKKVFTTTLSSNGTFTVSNFPVNAALDVIVSGYAKKINAITTLDSTVPLTVSDIQLVAVNSDGDKGAVRFDAISNAFSTNNNYSNNSRTTVTSWIQPTNTLTLAFSEAINSTLLNTNSIAYVRVFTDEYLQALTTLQSAEANLTKILDNQAQLIHTYVNAYETLKDYLIQNAETTNVMFNSAAFQSAYNTYYAALRPLLLDVMTSGIDEINEQNLTFFNLDDFLTGAESNITLDTLPASVTYTPLSSALVATNYTQTSLLAMDQTIVGNINFNSIATANTDMGIIVAKHTTLVSALADIEDTIGVTNVAIHATDATKVTVTLSETLPNYNVVRIGLVLFDFVDSSGNMLTNLRTDGNLGAGDHPYIYDVLVGTTY